MYGLYLWNECKRNSKLVIPPGNSMEMNIAGGIIMLNVKRGHVNYRFV